MPRRCEITERYSGTQSADTNSIPRLLEKYFRLTGTKSTSGKCSERTVERRSLGIRAAGPGYMGGAERGGANRCENLGLLGLLAAAGVGYTRLVG